MIHVLLLSTILARAALPSLGQDADVKKSRGEFSENAVLGYEMKPIESNRASDFQAVDSGEAREVGSPDRKPHSQAIGGVDNGGGEEEYTIDGWQNESGLPQITVTSLAQTPDGYLWLGTMKGLLRFDGVRFKSYHSPDATRKTSNRIVQLKVDRSGSLWIVTESGGLFRFADERAWAYSEVESNAAFGDGALASDLSGGLYWGSQNNLEWLRIRENQGIDSAANVATLKGVRPLPLLDGGSGYWFNRVWTGRQSGGRSTYSELRLSGSGAVVEIELQGIAPGRGGTFWLAARDSLYQCDSRGMGAKVSEYPQSLEEPTALGEGREGQVWVGTRNAGLFCRETAGRWLRFTSANGLAANAVNDLLNDREGNLWVATSGGGLLRIKRRLIQVYEMADGLAGNLVTSVAQDRDGRIWCGISGNGVNSLKGGRVSSPTEWSPVPAGLFSDIILPSRDGSFWGAGGGQGIIRFHAGQVSAYDLDAPGQPFPILALMEDSVGGIWIGTLKGLYRIQGGQLTAQTPANGWPSGEVRALAVDRKRCIYIGTGGGGISCWQDGRFTSFTEQDGLSDNHVASLYVDHEDTLWIGTDHGGLNRFKQGRFTRVASNNGLAVDTIGSLVDDDFGNLWMGSSSGILKVSKAEVEEVASGRRRSVTCYTYGRSDGLSTLACASARQPGAWKARDGRLWFATAKGVAVLDPANLPADALPLKVVIEEVLIDNEPRDLCGALPRDLPLETVIPPRKHQVEFRYTGLSLTAPERVMFRYRLAKIDQDWVEAGPRRVAHYSGLAPGRYQFCVQARNGQGAWEESGALLGLYVQPFWWMSTWFRVLAGFGLAGLVGIAYWRRVSRLELARAAQQSFSRRLIEFQERERQRISSELHDGLGQDLLVIKNRSLMGAQDCQTNPGALEQFDAISQMASQSLNEVREISRNLRPYQLDQLGLTRAAQAIIASVSKASSITFAQEVDRVDSLLPAEHEIHLYRILQELLNNIVKHSGAAKARVSLKHQCDNLSLCVADDGRGFPGTPADKDTATQSGLGLTDIAERVSILGGTSHRRTSPGHGTQWTIEIPLRPSHLQDSKARKV